MQIPLSPSPEVYHRRKHVIPTLQSTLRNLVVFLEMQSKTVSHTLVRPRTELSLKTKVAKRKAKLIDVERNNTFAAESVVLSFHGIILPPLRRGVLS
jgi:hypothetical protein